MSLIHGSLLYHQENIREMIATALEKQGLILLGIVDLDVRNDFEKFSEWLDNGLHSGMTFLERNLHCREQPELLLPGAQSAIVFALNYYRGDQRLAHPADGEAKDLPQKNPGVAQYARTRDYHKTMRMAGERAWQQIANEILHVPHDNGRVLVDSAPLLERALAAKTQRGFVGKNTCYIHPVHGSFLLLAEVLCKTALPLDHKVPINPEQRSESGGCGSCKRCQVACPTNALGADYVLDARKCLSYWTIEHRGAVPEEFWPHFATFYFGCDICQSVCPYNRGAQIAHGSKEMELPSLFATATMNQRDYETWFGGTPMTRAKRDGLQRNALIAMTVRRDPELLRALETESCTSSPMLRQTVEQILEWRAKKP